jgi:hypothetical protein
LAIQYARLGWSAERSFSQTNRITFPKACRCDNSSGEGLAHYLGPIGALKLLNGSVQSLSYLSNYLGVEDPK